MLPLWEVFVRKLIFNRECNPVSKIRTKHDLFPSVKEEKEDIPTRDYEVSLSKGISVCIIEK